MVLQKDPINGFLMKAARMALETGNPEHILIWVPEESENSLKNLLEKTWCERNKHKNRQNPDNDWFFTAIKRLFKAGRKPDYTGMKTAGPEEKLIYRKVEKAIDTNSVDYLVEGISQNHADDIKKHFNDILDKKNYDSKNIAAGRAYVAALIEFTEFLLTLHAVNP